MNGAALAIPREAGAHHAGGLASGEHPLNAAKALYVKLRNTAACGHALAASTSNSPMCSSSADPTVATS